MNLEMKFALHSLMADWRKSIMAIFGVFLASLLVFLIISISSGVEKKAKEILSTFGDRNALVYISPSSSLFSTTRIEMRKKDIKLLQLVSEIIKVYPLIGTKAKVESKKKVTFSSVFGINGEAIKEIEYYELKEGRIFSENAKEAVLGNEIAEILEVRVGQKIKINDQEFKVVGILKPTPTSGDNQAILIPIKEAKNLLNKTSYDAAIARLSEGADLSEVEKKIKDVLAYGTRDREDIKVITSDYLRRNILSILNIISMGAIVASLLASIAGIFGIANVSLTSVIRKKREIGILMAIGMKKLNIKKIFLLETMMISLIGVLGAITIGTILVALLQNTLPIDYSIYAYILPLLIGLGVGILASLAAIKKITSLQIIEAIR